MIKLSHEIHEIPFKMEMLIYHKWLQNAKEYSDRNGTNIKPLLFRICLKSGSS
jgi:hypothetical protein